MKKEDPDNLFSQLTAADFAGIADIEVDELGEIVEPRAALVLEEDGGEAGKKKAGKKKTRPPLTPEQTQARAAKAAKTRARNARTAELVAEFTALRLNAFSKPTFSIYIFDAQAHLDHHRAASKPAFQRLYAALHPAATKADAGAGAGEVSPEAEAEADAEAAWRAAEEGFLINRRLYLRRYVLFCDNAGFDAALEAYIKAQLSTPETPLERWSSSRRRVLR